MAAYSAGNVVPVADVDFMQLYCTHTQWINSLRLQACDVRSQISLRDDVRIYASLIR
jgi:hypothetical protein